jgi:hypothetical protein
MYPLFSQLQFEKKNFESWSYKIHSIFKKIKWTASEHSGFVEILLSSVHKVVMLVSIDIALSTQFNYTGFILVQFRIY